MASLTKIAKSSKQKKVASPAISAVLNRVQNRVIDTSTLEQRRVPTLFIMPNPNPELQQPRTEFDEAAIQALADNMKRVGQLQPILVSKEQTSGEYEGKYFIQDGECRWRAAKIAGITELAVFINPRELTKEELLEIQLSANEQRNSLTLFELASSIKRLTDGGRSIVEIAKTLGKTRAYITDINRLNTAPDYLCDYFRRTGFKDVNSIGLLAVSAERDPVRFEALFAKYAEADDSMPRITRAECHAIKDAIDGVTKENTATEVPAPVTDASSEAQASVKQREDEVERYLEEEANDPDVVDNPFAVGFEEEEAASESEEATGKGGKTPAKPKKQSRWELPEGALTLSNFRAMCYRVKVRESRKKSDVYRHGTLMSIVTLAEKDKLAFLYRGKVTGISKDQIVAVEGMVMADQVRCDDDHEETAA